MKKFVVTAAACALTLAVGGTVFAQCRTAGGCDSCNQGWQQSQKDPGSGGAERDPYRQFQQNTLDLRQAMMNKRFELQRENLMAIPDAAKIVSLNSDIRAIQARIIEIRMQSGLPDTGKRDGECFSLDGGCFKQNGGGDCNGQPCGIK